MKIAVFGGTGFIGMPLCMELRRRGWGIVIFTRNPVSARAMLGSEFEIVPWDIKTPLPMESLRGIDAVINLAGESIGSGRWTPARKQLIISSRLKVTRDIVEAVAGMDKKPAVLVNATAIGYYGPHGDEKLCEDAENGSDFLATVCRAWEDEAVKAEAYGVRVVRLRIGVVLGEGGALARMLPSYKLFFGGPLGSGRQWFSWVHRDDVTGIIAHALENTSLSGPVNATGPEPLTMKAFSRVLGTVLHRPSWLPVPGIILKLALGEMSDMVLTGQRVLPCEALETGYRFKFATADEALRDILR